MDATVEWNRTIRRRIYLLRHGDVSYFDEHGKPFRPATVPLNEEGRLQAEAAGRVLAEIPLDRVVSSDLVRSSETANLVIDTRPSCLFIRLQEFLGPADTSKAERILAKPPRADTGPSQILRRIAQVSEFPVEDPT